MTVFIVFLIKYSTCSPKLLHVVTLWDVMLVWKTECNPCIWRTGPLIQSNSNRWAFRLVSRQGHFKCHTEYQTASKKLQGNLSGHFYRYQLSRTLIRINFKTWSAHTHTLCGPVKRALHYHIHGRGMCAVSCL